MTTLPRAAQHSHTKKFHTEGAFTREAQGQRCRSLVGPSNSVKAGDPHCCSRPCLVRRHTLLKHPTAQQPHGSIYSQMEQRELASLRIALRANQDMLTSREALIGAACPPS